MTGRSRFLTLCLLEATLLIGASSATAVAAPGTAEPDRVLHEAGSESGASAGRRAHGFPAGTNGASQADSKIVALKPPAKDLSRHMEELEKEQTDAKRVLLMLYEESRKDRAKASERLVTLYKYGQIGYALVFISLLEKHSFCDAFQTATRLYEEDQALFSRIQKRTRQIQDLERTLFENEESLKDVKSRLQDLDRKASSSSGDREGEYPEKAIRHGDRLYDRIEHLVKGAPAGPEWPEDGASSHSAPKLKSFAERHGSLPLPTEGSIIDSYDGRTHGHSLGILYNRGIIIHAPKGQPILAVHDGSVVFADWLKEYGNVVIVSHGDHYYTLFAHLGVVNKNVDELVKAGEAIATVGDTGSTVRPRLYFEIRHHGKPLDPMEWLAVDKSSKE